MISVGCFSRKEQYIGLDDVDGKAMFGFILAVLLPVGGKVLQVIDAFLLETFCHKSLNKLQGERHQGVVCNTLGAVFIVKDVIAIEKPQKQRGSNTLVAIAEGIILGDKVKQHGCLRTSHAAGESPPWHFRKWHERLPGVWSFLSSILDSRNGQAYRVHKYSPLQH
ncbi:hypothetical protein EVA_11284 [gut metagenome]|uniref:Uncharacterized protein n=1 Tax=gut metagenome TaxID=749906 RepID=J9G1A9_9ZZZZ